MIIDRLFTGEDGHTHFGQIEVALEDAGDIGSLSEAFGAESVIFRTNPGSYDFDFHHAPQRQLIVLLDGEIEVENALGEKRRYQSGNVVLAEDLTGSGHRTKSVDGRLRRSLFIPLGNTKIGEPL